MATIINTPRGDVADDSGAGVVLGIVIALLVIILFFVFGLPYLRGTPAPGSPSTGGTINVQIPSNSSGGSSSGGSSGTSY